MAKRKGCVICKVEPGVGALARIYASGVRQGHRESKAGENISENTDRLCATHRRQVEEADVAHLIEAGRTSARDIGEESKE